MTVSHDFDVTSALMSKSGILTLARLSTVRCGFSDFAASWTSQLYCQKARAIPEEALVRQLDQELDSEPENSQTLI